MTTEKQIVNALYRRDLRAFVERVFLHLNPGAQYLHNWHIDAIIYELMRIHNGEIKRLIITCPPRSLKSEIISVAFTAWLLGLSPEKNIIAASYGIELASQLSMKTRSVMESVWYQSCFPALKMDPMKNTQNEIRTTKQGARYSTSVGGSLTGMGGNLVIIDDPHKPEEALSDPKRENVHSWFGSTLLSRLNSKKNDAIIIVQQRVHEDDLTGRLLEKNDGWTHLCLPAIADEDVSVPIGSGKIIHRKPGDVLHPEREPIEILEELKSSMGSYVFSAQYLQRPIPSGQGMVKKDDFQRFELQYFRRKTNTDIYVQSWDIATSIKEHADYSVGLTWCIRDNNFYLLDMIRRRIEPFPLRKLIVSTYQKFRAQQVLVESTGVGETFISELKRMAPINLKPVRPKYDKESRMMGEVAAIESHRVFLPTEAPWLADYEYEMLKFPQVRHDDIVDATSQFLQYAREQSYGRPRNQVRVTPIPAPYRGRDPLFGATSNGFGFIDI